MRMVVDKNSEAKVVKITKRDGSLDRYNVEPLVTAGLISHHSTLGAARAAIGKSIQHPIRHTLSNAECVERNKEAKFKRGKRR